jgi:hypothetical protein
MQSEIGPEELNVFNKYSQVPFHRSLSNQGPLAKGLHKYNLDTFHTEVTESKP